MFKEVFSYLTELLKWGCRSDIFFLMYTFLRLIVSATRRRRDIKIPLSLSPPPHLEKFNIVSNDHRRTQKCNFCVSVCKTNFTDHHTPDTIHIFSDSILVCKMHDSYDKQKFWAFTFLPIKRCKQLQWLEYESKPLHENKTLQNAFKRT